MIPEPEDRGGGPSTAITAIQGLVSVSCVAAAVVVAVGAQSEGDRAAALLLGAAFFGVCGALGMLSLWRRWKRER